MSPVNASDSDKDIPLLDDVVEPGREDLSGRDERPPDPAHMDQLAPLVEQLAAEIDRELEYSIERTIRPAVEQAVQRSLVQFQQEVRIRLLERLLQKLPQIVRDAQTSSRRRND